VSGASGREGNDERGPEMSKEHYARNAAEGRTVRFSMSMNTNYVTPEAAEAAGISRLNRKITGGTLTPEQAKRVLDILLLEAG
jgi:hypothetical protein